MSARNKTSRGVVGIRNPDHGRVVGDAPGKAVKVVSKIVRPGRHRNQGGAYRLTGKGIDSKRMVAHQRLFTRGQKGMRNQFKNVVAAIAQGDGLG